MTFADELGSGIEDGLRTELVGFVVDFERQIISNDDASELVSEL